MGQDVARRRAQVGCLSVMPGEAFDLVAQHNTLDGLGIRDLDLERIAFDLAGDRTKDAEPRALIVAPRRQDECGPLPGLFSTRLRIEIDPDDVAGVWTVRLSQIRSRLRHQ